MTEIELGCDGSKQCNGRLIVFVPDVIEYLFMYTSC